MNYKVVLYNLALLCTITFYGQTSLECDLVQLTKWTLDKSPVIQQNELLIQNAEGSVRIQRSIFDYQLTAGFSLSKDKNYLFDGDPRNSVIDTDIIETNTTGFSLGLQRRFRVGLLAAVELDYDQLSDDFTLNQFGQQVNPFLSNHTVSSTLSLTQPLIRGRGTKVTTALEKASLLQLKSNENNYEFTSSLELAQMAIAYWQYLAAYKNTIIFKENEERVRNVLQITEELVKADKKPAGDLIQIKADLANQERQTTLAKQDLHNTRLNLGRVIGLSDTDSELLGVPKNGFPTIEESGFETGLITKSMIEIASKNRKDLEAFEKNKESAELQLNLANNNLKPQLDLTGFATYGGMNMGNGLDQAFNTLSNRQGRNYGVGLRLNFSFPLNNNLAKGNYTLSKTTLRDQEIGYNDLQRNIDLNVNIAVNNLKNYVLVLEKAAETLKHSKEVFKNEQIKFRNGLTTILNLILFQERLTFAQRDYLLAKQQFAVAIVNLRFETGTLISMTDNTVSSVIDTSIFYSIPK
ncbi:TolC family protein [uncultured Aquimarina sp.]|uniref:TolC family protein n=1 Tax=uncultured Aquimarina sp. TaxID=575652 RepID=UPI0026035B17|nr:TolC family protein [uncultured Aquimarina sp.]